MSWDGSFLLYAAARWLGYLAAFAIIGVATLRRAVLPRTSASPATTSPLHQVGRLGLVALAVSLGARLYFQTRSLLDPEDPVTAEFVGLVLESRWGHGWLAQATAAVAAFLTWTWVGRRPTSALASGSALVAAGAIAVAAPFTGHAVGLAGAPWYAPLLDLAHFGAGAAWLGTLAMLVVVLRTSAAGAALPGGAGGARGLVEAFSPVALTAGVIAMASGGILAFTYLGGIAPLFETVYGRMVLIKLGAIGVTAGLGAYNWRSVLPRLRAGAPAPVLQTATAEAIVGAIILACSAVLVSLPAPGESAE
ncbi:MAG: copper resistance D family protein [Gemmatimonadales bacterium]